jgi:hypothetical protein
LLAHESAYLLQRAPYLMESDPYLMKSVGKCQAMNFGYLTIEVRVVHR